MLPVSLVASSALVAAAFAALLGVLRRAPWQRVLLHVALIAYVAWVVAMTLFPIPLQGPGPVELVASRLNRPNVVPLHTIVATLRLPSEWQRVRLLLGNVVVFVPFGVLLPAIGPRLRGWRRMLLAGLAFSGAIELGQLAVSLVVGYWYRMPDVDDVLLNVLGVLAGYALYAWSSRLTSRSR